MKTIYSLLCVLCATLFTNANAATLTVADLAGAVNRGDGVVELTSDVTVAAGDVLDCGGVATLLLADNVTLTVHGTLLKEGSDVLTIAGSGDAPAGNGNGNGGVPYELYNNSTITVWAQNNTWGTGAQDAQHIEPLIFHKKDNATLGEVIYLPAGSTGLDTVDADSTLAYDAVTATVSGRGPIIVLDSGGRVVASGERQVTASHLSPGAYLATNGQRSIKFIITK
ncbi:MAG: hypothetical protein IJU62_04765 [Muribaculaceae bacterium]|nr:hypothetical protein [Muribaculaceae bacterium]